MRYIENIILISKLQNIMFGALFAKDTEMFKFEKNQESTLI